MKRLRVIDKNGWFVRLWKKDDGTYFLEVWAFIRKAGVWALVCEVHTDDFGFAFERFQFYAVKAHKCNLA